MALTIGVVLSLLGIAVAVYPFFQHRLFPSPPEMAGEAAEKAATDSQAASGGDLDSIYQAIRTLQLERELGNVPEGLFREQLNGYRIEAATLLRAMEQEQEAGEEWVLEEEIRMARAGLRPSSEVGAACADCGRSVPAEVDACPECGVPDAGRAENRRPSTAD
ncbi:MAG: hypothetical protein OXI91_09935 [Chloroflexota bacterium]|nr:hypothetical protein [Chloroflexota bacterium]